MKIDLIDVDSHRWPNLRLMNDPYVMIYDRPSAPPVTRQLQQWVNNKRIFHTVSYCKDYTPGRRIVPCPM